MGTGSRTRPKICCKQPPPGRDVMRQMRMDSCQHVVRLMCRSLQTLPQVVVGEVDPHVWMAVASLLGQRKGR